MTHQFQYLRPANPVYKSLLSHLIQPRLPENTAQPKPETSVEERTMMRAFSDELEKVAWAGAAARSIWEAAKAGAPWIVGGELGYEALDRFLHPNAEHRSPFQIAKDSLLGIAMHAPIAAGVGGLEHLPGKLTPGSWGHWFSEGARDTAKFLGLNDPRLPAALRVLQPTLENKPDKPGTGSSALYPEDQASAPKTRQPGMEDLPVKPSYSVLRRMDPRYVSARYLT